MADNAEFLPRPADVPLIAADVARGVSRLFFRADLMVLCEVPLGNGRRADIMAIDGRGGIVIVEIKVSRADLLGDMKWPDYLDYCDRFFFAKPPELDAGIFPAGEGLIVADSHGAEILRMAEETVLSPPRRKAMMLKLARLGADRVHALMDPLTGSEGP